MGETLAGIPNRDFNSLPLPDLYQAVAPEAHVRALLELARNEDLAGTGDITTQLICSVIPCQAERTATASVIAAGSGVVAGLALLPTLLDVFGSNLRHTDALTDGTTVRPGAILTTLSGPLNDILTVERTLLNFLGRLSGVASLTAQYVEKVRGTRAVVLDTRKTTPGHRGLEKYAVRCGGGHCHRIGLYDAILIKDNHIAGLSDGLESEGLMLRLADARSHVQPMFLEIEVDSLEQLQTILTWPAGIIDIVLLDNMAPAQLAQAVTYRNASNPALLLEASGGVTLGTVTDIARSGVDRISVGALTHSAPTLDIRLDLTH